MKAQPLKSGNAQRHPYFSRTWVRALGKDLSARDLPRLSVCIDKSPRPIHFRRWPAVKERSGMPYDVVAYEADELAMQLSESEEGLFHRMLRRAWMNGSIPDNLDTLASICRTRPSTMKKAWVRIAPLWKGKEDDPGRLINSKQESERAYKASYSAKKSASGHLGNEIKSQMNAEKRRMRMKEARAKGTHTQAEWEYLKELTDNRCVKCGTDEYNVERDHVLPVYQGGSDSIENIQPLCARCNAKKGPESIDYVTPSIRFALCVRARNDASPSPSPPRPLSNTEDNSSILNRPQAEKQPAARPRDLAMDFFTGRFHEHTGIPYGIETADAVQLARLRKNCSTPSLEQPPDWESAVKNYFASPLSQYSLADLANLKRYAVFKNSALDSYNKPINHKGNGNGQRQIESKEQSRERRAIEGLAAMLEDRVDETRLDFGSGGVPGKDLALRNPAKRVD